MSKNKHAWQQAAQTVPTGAARAFAAGGTFDEVLGYLASQCRSIATNIGERDASLYGIIRDATIPSRERHATTCMQTLTANASAMADVYYRTAGADPSFGLEGHIRASLHNERHELTSFKYKPDSVNPLDRVWVHTQWRNVRPILDHCRDLFQIAMEMDLHADDLQDRMADLMWWFFHAHAFVRGTSTIGAWLMSYIMQSRGAQPLHFKDSPAAMALVCANPFTYRGHFRTLLAGPPTPWPPSRAGTELQLCYAARRGDLNAVKSLLRQVTPDAVETTGYSALHLAAREGHTKVVKLLLSAQADATAAHPDSHILPLHLAAQTGHLKIVQLLAAGMPDINAADYTGSRALHLAVRANEATVAQFLIASHANVDASDALGRTPLHYAAVNGDLLTAKTLITRARPNADINALDKNLENPLSLASTAGHHELVTYLLKNGATAPAQDTQLTMMSTSDSRAQPLMKGHQRWNPGLYRLLLRVAKQGHAHVADIFKARLMRSISPDTRDQAARVLSDMEVKNGRDPADQDDGLVVSILP